MFSSTNIADCQNITDNVKSGVKHHILTHLPDINVGHVKVKNKLDDKFWSVYLL